MINYPYKSLQAKDILIDYIKYGYRVEIACTVIVICKSGMLLLKDETLKLIYVKFGDILKIEIT